MYTSLAKEGCIDASGFCILSLYPDISITPSRNEGIYLLNYSTKNDTIFSCLIKKKLKNKNA